MPDDDADNYVRRLLADVAEAGRQRRLVEAERPGAALIGGALGTSIELTSRILEAARRVTLRRLGEDPDQTYALRSLPTSVAASDSKWLSEVLAFDSGALVDEDGQAVFYLAHPLIDPVQCAVDFVQRFVRAAFDHLEALALLVRKDVGFRATAVLSRAALEACAAATYLTDGNVSSAERLRRLWNLQCEQFTEDLRRDRDDSELTHRHREEVLQAAETVGFVVQRVRANERHRSPKILADDGRSHSSASDMIDAALTPEVGRSMWQGLSDVAHSRSSGFMFLDEFTPRELQIPAMRTESIALHAMPALIAFQRLGDQLQTYLGWDELSWSVDFEPVLRLWSASSGGADETIRRALGLPPE